MFQQQMNLPYSPEQQQIPMLNIGINNPPYVPQYSGPQQIQGIAAPVAALVAMELQNNAQRNPLRMFMFNLYAQNNYANNEFHQLVVGALDYIALLMSSNQYPSLDVCAQQAIPRIVGLACAMLIMQYSALERYIDPSNVNNIKNDISTFQNIGQQIENMKAMANRQMNQQNMNSQFAVRGGYGNMSGNQGTFGNVNQQQNTGLFSSSGRGVFGNNPASGGSSASFERYADDNPKHALQQPFAARDQKVVSDTVQQQNNTGITKMITKEVEASETEVAWTPSKKYPYYPAHNPFTHKLIYTLENDKVVDCKVIDKETKNMDYERHSLKSVFGPTSPEMDFTNTVSNFENIRKGIIQLNDAVYTEDEEEKKKYDIYVKPSIIVETTLQEAWLAASLDRLQNNDIVPDVYRAFALIAEPIIGNKDETSFIETFHNSNTFIELREKLNSCVNEISDELWAVCNTKMTKTINRILKQYLGLPTLSIESFVTDIQELIEYLGGDSYGDYIKESFLKYQKDHIAATFRTMYEQEADTFTSIYFDDRAFNESVSPVITYPSTMFSLTLLNCRSHDLELQLNTESASVLTEALCPTMYSLVKGLFDDIEQHPERSVFDRHLIRTTDARVLECTKGQLGTDAYLLMLIK